MLSLVLLLASVAVAQEAPLLMVLGGDDPGNFLSGSVELISTDPENNPCNGYLSNLPRGTASVGSGVSPGGEPIVCGGRNSEGGTDKCFTYVSSGVWESSGFLPATMDDAASDFSAEWGLVMAGGWTQEGEVNLY